MDRSGGVFHEQNWIAKASQNIIDAEIAFIVEVL
jgi:hypothetical protein